MPQSPRFAETAHEAAERVARESYGRLLSYLAARCRDIVSAEDGLADAFARALASWSRDGIPENPEAWLLTVARNKLVDDERRNARAQALAQRIGVALNQAQSDIEEARELPDERAAMMFACAHPAIDEHVRGPLILHAVLGVDAAMIASAYLTSPSAMSQRLVRAKRKIAAAAIPLRVPEAAELPDRLPYVLAALYASFSAGCDDPFAMGAPHHALARQALWLARVVVQALPEEPEASGLLSLMLHVHARRDARRDAQGRYVPLESQDVNVWHDDDIAEAERLLHRASRAGRPGRFQTEAAIQSVHAARRSSGTTDWPSIVTLYDALRAFVASPIVVLNRAVALARSGDPRRALAEIEAIGEPRMQSYQPYWAAKAAILDLCGERERARDAYDHAIALSTDPSTRHYLAARRLS